jgi:hypothetical protein
MTPKKLCNTLSMVEQPIYTKAHSIEGPGGWGHVTQGSAPRSTDASTTHHLI